MKFTKNDLQQIDENYLCSLTLKKLKIVSCNLLADLKEAVDRLNQNSTNSSTPPSKDAPWQKGGEFIDDDSDESTLKIEDEPSDDSDSASKNNHTEKNNNADDAINDSPSDSKKPGRQPGSQGHGRSVELPVTDIQEHKPTECASCGDKFHESTIFKCITGLYVLDFIPSTCSVLGISLSHIKHIYFEAECECGHISQCLPGRCEPEEGWTVELTEWHLCGPMLVTFIVCLSSRFRLSRRKIREFCNDWLGIKLSIGVINQCIHEAGRAVSPVEEQLIEQIQNSGLLHIDETGWLQLSSKLWLWVFATTSVCLFMIGKRTKTELQKILSIFTGWVMSDGYGAYRHYKKRLRCWAHLIRKLKGLAQSMNKEARIFGQRGLTLFDLLIEAIRAARDGPNNDIFEEFSQMLKEFKKFCLDNSNSDHKKTRELAREFLNDWEAIWRVLSNVTFPMTNNEAERLLRHWVISRQISYGTRTDEGSRAFCLLASVIETCRLRQVSPWPYIAKVITERRKNNPPPPLPEPVVLSI